MQTIPIGSSFLQSGTGDDNAALTEILNCNVPKISGWYEITIDLVSSSPKQNVGLRYNNTSGQDVIPGYLISSPSGVKHTFIWYGDVAQFSLVIIAAGTGLQYYGTICLTPIKSVI